MWTTKRMLREQINDLEVKLTSEIALNEKLIAEMNEIKQLYPFELGQVVYDIQLRNDKGRYTKKNPSREHSVVNEVTVDKKNYFNLVDRYKSKDVFTTRVMATKYLDELCKE